MVPESNLFYLKLAVLHTREFTPSAVQSPRQLRSHGLTKLMHWNQFPRLKTRRWLLQVFREAGGCEPPSTLTWINLLCIFFFFSGLSNGHTWLAHEHEVSTRLSHVHHPVIWYTLPLSCIACRRKTTQRLNIVLAFFLWFMLTSVCQFYQST